MGKLLIDTDRSYLLSPKDEVVLLIEKELAELEPDNVVVGIDYASGLFSDKSVKTKARILEDGKIEVVSVEEFDYEKDMPDTVISFRKKNVATINGSSKYLKKLLNEGEVKFINNQELLKELKNINDK